MRNTCFGMFLSFMLILIDSVWASPSIPVDFYYVRSPRAIPFAEAKRAVRQVQGFYRHYFDAKIIVKMFRKQRDIFPDTLGFNDSFKRFFAWSDWTLKTRNRGKITQVLTGPLLYKDDWYSAGLGFIGCFKETDLLNFSIAYITLISSNKHDRFVHAKAVIAHELGHNLSAHHVHDCTLMDTYLLSCLGNVGKKVTGPNDYSKKEINRCLNIP